MRYLDKIRNTEFIVNVRNINTREKYLIECRE